MSQPRPSTAATAGALGLLSTPMELDKALQPGTTMQGSSLSNLLFANGPSDPLKLNHTASPDQLTLVAPTTQPCTDMTGMLDISSLIGLPSQIPRAPAPPLPDSGIQSLGSALGYSAAQAEALLADMRQAEISQRAPTPGPFAYPVVPMTTSDRTAVRPGISIPRTFSIVSTDSFATITEEDESLTSSLIEVDSHGLSSIADTDDQVVRKLDGRLMEHAIIVDPMDERRTPTPALLTPVHISDLRRLSCATIGTPGTPSDPSRSTATAFSPRLLGKTSPPRIFRCDDCEYKTDKQAHLVRHAKSHSGERPYACTACDKTFPRMDSLRRHQRLHDKRDGPGELRKRAQQIIQKRVRNASVVAMPAERTLVLPFLPTDPARRDSGVTSASESEFAVAANVYGTLQRMPDSPPEDESATMDAGPGATSRGFRIEDLLSPAAETPPAPPPMPKVSLSRSASYGMLLSHSFDRRLSTPNMRPAIERPMPSESTAPRRGSHAGYAFGSDRIAWSNERSASTQPGPSALSRPPVVRRVTGPANFSYDQKAVARFEPFSTSFPGSATVAPGYKFPGAPVQSTTIEQGPDVSMPGPDLPTEETGTLHVFPVEFAAPAPIISLPLEPYECPTTPRDDLAKALPTIGGKAWTKPSEIPDKPEYVPLEGINIIAERYCTPKPMQAVKKAQELASDWKSVDVSRLSPPELDRCIQNFFEAFHRTMPVIHATSFLVREASELLLLTIICIGSLYLKEKRGRDMGVGLWRLVQKAVRANWRTLNKEAGHFDSGPGTALCQTILLSQIYANMSADPCIRSETYPDQGMGYRMAVLSGLLRQERVDPAKYLEQAKDDEGSDIAWRSWAAKEAQLRAILGHYILDGKMSEAVGVPSTLKHLQNGLHAVCDDKLFFAPSAKAWQKLISTSGPTDGLACTYADLYRQLFRPGPDTDVKLDQNLQSLSRMTLLVGIQATIADLGPSVKDVPIALPKPGDMAVALARLYSVFKDTVSTTRSCTYVHQMAWHCMSICLQMRILDMYSQPITKEGPLYAAASPESMWAHQPLARRMLLHANAIRLLALELPRTKSLGHPQFYVPQFLHCAASIFISFVKGMPAEKSGREVNLERRIDWEALGLLGYENCSSPNPPNSVSEFVEQGGQPIIGVADTAGRLSFEALGLAHVSSIVTQLKLYGEVWGIAKVWAREIEEECQGACSR